MAFFVTAHELAHQWWGHQNLGLDLLASTYRAQNEIHSSGSMLNGPVVFKAKDAITLNTGFTTSSEFEAMIKADPCND